MTGRSRRGVLAGAGAGLAALAGCSVSLGTDETADGEALRRLADEERFERPYPHPLSIPDAMVTRHRERARALLDGVPVETDIPNELIATRIERERERLAERLDAGASGAESPDGQDDAGDAGGPDGDDGATASARDRLREARRRRREAAALRGTYRAATGGIDRADVERRRDAQRGRLAAFRAAWDYRAAAPVRAALVHAHLENLVDGAEHALTPWPQFPADPAADVEQVGYIAEKVEEAAAALDDLERYREQVAGERTTGYRPALMAAATWLRRRARREAFRHEAYLDEGVEAFDRDLGESVARYRFVIAREVAREYSNRDLIDRIDAGGYANAVLFAATRRAAVTALAASVEAVESDETGGEVSVQRIEAARRRAREAIETALDRGPVGLLARLLGPAFTALDEARRELEHGASGTPARALGGYRYAAEFAETAADAADELAFLLEEST